MALSNPAPLKYSEKAAIMLMALELSYPGITSKVFSYLGQARSKQLLETIHRMRKVNYDVVDAVTLEFHEMAIEQKVVFGGKNVSQKILQDSFGIESADLFFGKKDTLFTFLNGMEDRILLPFFGSETDQMVALLLSYMEGAKASRLLLSFSPEKAARLSQMMVQLSAPNDALLWDLHAKLEQHLKTLSQSQDATGNLLKVSHALELMSVDERMSVMTLIKGSDPVLSQHLDSLIFSFEDLIDLPDRDLQTVLHEIDPLKRLAFSLHGVPDVFYQRVIANVSQRVRLILNEETSNLGPAISEKDVLSARQYVIRLVRDLEKRGLIKPISKGVSRLDSSFFHSNGGFQ